MVESGSGGVFLPACRWARVRAGGRPETRRLAHEQVFYSTEIPSTLDALGRVINDALGALRRGDWIEDEQTFYARLCLEEAIVNAIIHGNRRDAARRVRLEMVDEGELCCIRVGDEGGGFSPDGVDLPPCDKPNGRGVCLIKHCMDSVTYDARHRRLEMRMRRKALCRGEHANG